MAGWKIEWPEWTQERADGAPASRSFEGLLDTMRAQPVQGMSANDDEGRPRRRMAGLQQIELSRIVEREVLPRLVAMHRRAPWGPDTPQPLLRLTSEHVVRLARLAVMGEAESAADYVRGLRAQGASTLQIYLDLLTPCARWLGELWEEDRCSFSQVTVALWRLQRVLHEQAQAPDLSHFEPRRALFASVPRAQHTFGVCMVADIFSRSGWDVDCITDGDWPDLQRAVAQVPLDLFGLSVSTSDSIPALADALARLRKASLRPDLFIMVGGPMASRVPDLAAQCGADAMASDALQAVALADAHHPARRRIQAA